MINLVAVAIEGRDRNHVILLTIGLRSCGKAFSTASAPAFNAAGLGGNHSGYHWLIAIPQYPIAQPGSASVTVVNPFMASRYQNECRAHTASLNVFWTADPQEIWKFTSPDAFAAAGPASARTPGWIGNVKRAAARKSTQICWRVMAITSRVRPAWPSTGSTMPGAMSPLVHKLEQQGRGLGVRSPYDALWRVLPDSQGRRDRRRAVDPARGGRDAGRQHSFQRYPAWRSADVTDAALQASEGIGARRCRRAPRYQSAAPRMAPHAGRPRACAGHSTPRRMGPLLRSGPAPGRRPRRDHPHVEYPAAGRSEYLRNAARDGSIRLHRPAQGKAALGDRQQSRNRRSLSYRPRLSRRPLHKDGYPDNGTRLGRQARARQGH